jgi:hypothetical protein
MSQTDIYCSAGWGTLEKLTCTADSVVKDGIVDFAKASSLDSSSVGSIGR